MKEELICVNCPMGCRLLVVHEGGKILEIKGNQCKRGAAYAEKEIFCPERLVTTTVRIDGAASPLLPVKTSRPVLKDLTFDVVEAARDVRVQAPIARGAVILKNVLNTGADLVATRSLPRLS